MEPIREWLDTTFLGLGFAAIVTFFLKAGRHMGRVEKSFEQNTLDHKRIEVKQDEISGCLTDVDRRLVGVETSVGHLSNGSADETTPN